jgi:hypothetical protein
VRKSTVRFDRMIKVLRRKKAAKGSLAAQRPIPEHVEASRASLRNGD